MRCAWQELLAILPIRYRDQVDRLGKESAREIRFRLGSPPEIVLKTHSQWLEGTVNSEDLDFTINAASRYSPWAAASVGEGYLTAAGGHRIGICGEATVKDGRMTGIRRVTSLCIRVARDFPGIAKDTAALSGSILIIGAPGFGKTTLLRDLLRQISGSSFVSVVDERGELFPEHFQRGKRLDVLGGCSKKEGIELVLRSMGPECIGVDEITAAEDCKALVHAAWCGVRLIATAHAGSVRDLMARPVYRPLVESGIFDHVLVLDKDKRWTKERMEWSK